MDRRSIHRLAAAVVLVVVVVVGVMVALALGDSGVLEGETHHDFGIVRLSGEGARVEHTFRLRNPLDEPVEIGRIKTSCGCAAATPSTTTVEPGQTVDIPAWLLIKASLRKRATLSLDLGGHGVQQLTVEALGRRAEPLFVRRPTLEVVPNEPIALNVYLELDEDGGPPPRPVATAPEGIVATLGEWKQGRKRNAANAQPAVWSLPLEVTLKAERLPQGAAVTVALDEERRAIVPLVPPVVEDPGSDGRDDVTPG